jgi:hypothetical protein
VPNTEQKKVAREVSHVIIMVVRHLKAATKTLQEAFLSDPLIINDSPVAILPTNGSRSIIATHIEKGSSTNTCGGGTCFSSTSSSGPMLAPSGGGAPGGGSVKLAQPWDGQHNQQEMQQAAAIKPRLHGITMPKKSTTEIASTLQQSASCFHGLFMPSPLP